MSINILEIKYPVFPQLCAGCGACSNICHQKAITMELDSEGFYKPFFDDSKCISCGRCMDICPVLKPEYKNNNSPKCLAFMASDETRMRSSSGGAFEIMAKKVIKDGGLVCGVAYNEDFLTEHIFIDNINELHKIRGSKYIMSDTNDVYSRIKKFILDGRKVLFSGCPCQVAGLSAFLGDLRFNDNLILVDLICHGIPSVKAFKNYLKDLHANHKIKYVGFKEKEYGWHASMTIEFEDIDKYNAPCEKDAYFWSYLSGVNINKACGDCKFAKIPRQGDITIGDFWGISKLNQNLNDGKGTSVVLLNNRRGEEFWSSLDLSDCKCEKAPIEIAIMGNVNITSSPKIHVSRTQFFKNLGIRKFGELANWCYSAERYDIGLVGIPIYVNFGGALTYYSLYCLLKDNGFKTLMISRPRSCGHPPIMPEMVFEANPYPNNGLRLQIRDKEEMSDLNNFCETFLVGSDQLFNADLYYRFGEMVTLDWVTDNHKKIAYAASFGHDVFWGRDEQRAKMAHYMQKFDAFSVREEDGVKLAKEYFGVDAEWVLDPVFLCNKNHYLKLAERTERKSTEKHIFSYILDSSEDKNDILDRCAERLSLNVELFSGMLYKPTKEKIEYEQKKFTYNLRQALIEERLFSLIHSDFVVTDSFHGVCFAIIFHIPFVAILNKNRGASRFYTLLNKLSLRNRLVIKVEEVDAVLATDIDFKAVDSILDIERDRCIKWLLDAIQTKKAKKAFSSVDIINNKLRILENRLKIKDIKINSLLNGKMYYKETNFRNYLQKIIPEKRDLLILIAVKDTPGFQFDEDMESDMKNLGAEISLVGKHWQSYVCIIDSGNLLHEAISKNEERIAYTGIINGKEYKVVSRSFRKGNVAAIKVDGVEYAENHRGINIVLVDKSMNEVVDSVAFDTHDPNVPSYRFGVKNSSPCKDGMKVLANDLSEDTNTEEKSACETKLKVDTVQAPGIKKTNEVLLHNSLAIAAGGGCTLDYIVDKGIKKIAIYGTDLLVAFLWEQAQYKEIEVVALYSDMERELDVRFPRVGKIKMISIDSIDASKINVPIIVAEIGYPINVLRIRQEHNNVWKLSELNIYSSVKNFLFEYIKKYRKNGVNIPVLVFSMPKSNEIENSSELEKHVIVGDSLRNSNEIRKKVFMENGFGIDYIKAVTERMTLEKRGKTNFVADSSNEYVNVVNGYRITTDVPQEFENMIYFFGNSVCYGLGADDGNTMASHLQRRINQYYGNNTCYSVLNCANGGGLNVEQMWNSFTYHMPQEGDIVILAFNGFVSLLEDIYAEEFIWINGSDVLNRPHSLGEIYWDNSHVNSKGYKACADLIFSKMIQKNLLRTKDELKEIGKNRKIPIVDLELSEKQMEELEEYIETIKAVCTVPQNLRIGSIVMNCNPFTIGHRYLIEEAKKQCDILYIFVVEEDKSIFSFKDRIQLVQNGVNDIEDVIVVPSGTFIISQITFDAYFIKDENEDVSFDPTGDVTIFASKIAPELGINVRFVGEEPLDKVTNQYNATLMRVLPKFGIELSIIKRKEYEGVPISASLVRKLLKEKNFEVIESLVPNSTFEYLYNRFANSKNVLVLGGTRFMGIRLVENLIDKNYFVTIANRGTKVDKFGKKVKRIVYDRLDKEKVKNAFEGKKYDIVIDTSAYSSIAVKNILDYIECSRYVQVSSVAVYDHHQLNLKEEQFDSKKENYTLKQEKEYWGGKRGAECVALQEYPEISTAIVRIPFVVEAENLENLDLNSRLYFYVEHIIKGLPFFVADLEYCCSFVQTNEEADFLIYLSESEFEGVINFSSEGYVKIGEIIDYIEKKTNKKAIITSDGEKSPFYAEHFGTHGYNGFSFNLDVAKEIGYCPSDLKTWLFKLLDKYIEDLQV